MSSSHPGIVLVRLNLFELLDGRGEGVGDGAVAELVRGGDLELGQAGEHVELGEVEVREPVDGGRVVEGDDVEPADAPGAAGGGAVLVPLLAEVVRGSS